MYANISTIEVCFIRAAEECDQKKKETRVNECVCDKRTHIHLSMINAGKLVGMIR